MKRPRIFTLTAVSLAAFFAPFLFGEPGIVIRWFLIALFAVLWFLFERNPKHEGLASDELPSMNLTQMRLDRDRADDAPAP